MHTKHTEFLPCVVGSVLASKEAQEEQGCRARAANPRCVCNDGPEGVSFLLALICPRGLRGQQQVKCAGQVLESIFQCHWSAPGPLHAVENENSWDGK